MQKIGKALAKDIWIVLFDIVALNLSYYLALLIRFFVEGEFRPSVSFFQWDFLRFAPFYTVVALIIFIAFKLYGGMWKYAGINDMNRIIMANIVTSVVMVVGTNIFVRRMPITYYVIGGVLQLAFVVLTRFSYRMFIVEKAKLMKLEKIPALIVGSRELGRKTLKHLEDNTPYHAVFIIGNEIGRTLDGVPIVSLDEIDNVINKVNAVFIADKELSQTNREKIIKAAGDREIQDFTGALSNMNGAVPLTGLLDNINSALTVIIDGNAKKYNSGKEALAELHTRYILNSITAENLVIELKADDGLAYLQKYAKENGEEISFF